MLAIDEVRISTKTRLMRHFINIVFLFFILTIAFSCSPNSNKNYVVEYYENGVVKMEGDTLNGIVKNYYQDANLKSVLSYKNGKLHGECVAYYRNGNIRFKQQYRNGELDGAWVSYNENGRKLFKNYYDNGTLIKSVKH